MAGARPAPLANRLQHLNSGRRLVARLGLERPTMVSRAFASQLQGYGLTTAKILYRFPDYSSLLQEYVWQDYDLAPRFPELNKFLAFWRRTLDGPLFQVFVAHKDLIGASEMKVLDGEFRLH